MTAFVTTTMIHATAEAIWALLTDAAGYPSWTSTVTSITGHIAANQNLTVHAQPNPGLPFPVTVSAFQPPHTMSWTGTVPFGLFTGTRTFTLTPIPDNAVVFAMQETYSGLLESVIDSLLPDLQPVFDKFAADLKAKAEAMA